MRPQKTKAPLRAPYSVIRFAGVSVQPKPKKTPFERVVGAFSFLVMVGGFALASYLRHK